MYPIIISHFRHVHIKHFIMPSIIKPKWVETIFSYINVQEFLEGGHLRLWLFSVKSTWNKMWIFLFGDSSSKHSYGAFRAAACTKVIPS